ncbi:transglutaminase family protein [Alteromonas gracilis]
MPSSPAVRRVSSDVAAVVRAPARIVYSVAVAQNVAQNVAPAEETLEITLDGSPIPAQEVVDQWGSRFHVVDAEPGELTVAYRATIGAVDPLPATPLAEVEFFRPSRYAESDRLFAAAGDLFGGLEGLDLLDAVVRRVHDHTAYVSGSSRHTDGAVDTHLAHRGVCRDFAHLVIAYLRARNVPARLASVYAPGLSPMDFHAVVEAYVEGTWQLVDATRLAPRESMVRIATGRDAADTAFMTVASGLVDFSSMRVTATVDGDLPVEDPDARVVLG